MKVTLGFIFRGEDERKLIFDQVRPILESLYSFDEVITVDSGHTPFNRAASRNLVVKKASSSDVIVCCDADSIPEQKPLEMAVEDALSDHKLHIPFDRVRMIPYPRFLQKPYRYDRIKPTLTYGPSCGGVYVFRPYVWAELGGMDERVDGWGFEDRMMWSALQTYTLGPKYHEGFLYNVNHSRDVSSLTYPENNALMDRYIAAEGDEQRMMEVQRGSNDFCS